MQMGKEFMNDVAVKTNTVSNIENVSVPLRIQGATAAVDSENGAPDEPAKL